MVVLVLACFGYEEFLANSIRESSAGASSFFESHGTLTENPQQNKEVAKTSTTNLRTSGSGTISLSQHLGTNRNSINRTLKRSVKRAGLGLLKLT